MKRAFAIGAAFAAISLVGLYADSTRFLHAYLFAFLFWLDLSLGALPLLMMHRLTGGGWGLALRRIEEAVAGTIGWLGLGFLPIAFGMARIYPWLDARDPKILHKAAYLNAPGFLIRAGSYFVLWIIFARAMRDPRRGQGWAAAGLIVYVLTSTFASIDWQMSLEPLWYSTIYGMVYAAAQALTAYAFGLVVFGLRPPAALPKKTLLDLGNLALTLVMVWSYFSFMQYLVVWSGNLPEESGWFVNRTRGGWQMIAVALIVFQFFAPFGILLFRAIKSRPRALAGVGLLILLMRALDRYWTVMPGLYPEGIRLHWLDLTLWLALGGLWTGIFLLIYRRTPEPLASTPVEVLAHV